MNPCLCIVLAAGIAVGPVAAAPPSTFGQLERRMQELVEQERFEELARAGETAFARADLEPWQRRELAFYALRGYHRVFAVTGQAAGLCRARNLLRRVEREVGFGDAEAVASRLRDVTESGLAKQRPKDPCSKPRAAAHVPTPTPAELLPVVQRQRPVAPPPADDSQPALLDVSRHRPAPSAASPAAAEPAPAAPPATDPAAEVRSRNRVIAGSLLLVLGVGAGVGAGAALWRRSEANGEIIEIDRRVNAELRLFTMEELDRIAHLADVYRTLTPVAGITGAAAGVAAVAGVVLLATRHRGRTIARVSATPWSAMLTVSGRF
ncbi:hypothetical protein OV079_20960 [Nannocystis pusilla]|uniref:Uncharacterized protein n=1 Tax=Nannocystis pusilla TaxID=889268 RepID=A0A9X3EQH3_9BACT|nr:hypothetical protein [Nannocystis pusilla]MCY1007981.1 hypothetical protein [Nannocystis pusilla]